MRMQRWVARLVVLAVVPAALVAQDRLKTMPGYEQHQRIAPQISTALKPGSLAAAWIDGSKAIEYNRDGKRYRFDLAMRQTTELGPAPQGRGGRGQPPPGQPDRGRQFESALSPDGRLNAFYKDRNLWLSAPDGTSAVAITTDGSPTTRVTSERWSSNSGA